MASMLPRLFDNDVFGVFDPFDNRVQFPAVYGRNSERLMKTDIRETDQAYEFDVDLPGFKKEEVTAELKNGYLTVSAEKKVDSSTKDAKGRYVRQERSMGSCSRSFYVGKEVREGECKANFEDGVLKVYVPRTAVLNQDERKLITIH